MGRWWAAIVWVPKIEQEISFLNDWQTRTNKPILFIVSTMPWTTKTEKHTVTEGVGNTMRRWILCFVEKQRYSDRAESLQDELIVCKLCQQAIDIVYIPPKPIEPWQPREEKFRLVK